jgi:hypothetical protein
MDIADVRGRPVDRVPMPARIARLPRNKVGYPIPWFVAAQPDGTFDFRVADPRKQILAGRERLCWVCGQQLGVYVSFPIGPMCAVNRISGEPPAHRECAEYSARACPFLAIPGMRRRDRGDLDWAPAAGEMNERNPGAVLVWTTRTFKAFRPALGNDGILYQLGEPTSTSWWREGRAATRAEALVAMQAGLPVLLEACDRDDDPEASGRDVLHRFTQALAKVVPA